MTMENSIHISDSCVVNLIYSAKKLNTSLKKQKKSIDRAHWKAAHFR